MELRQLEYFVAVARELHFGRAAAGLHVAQPSISQQIRALEEELGIRLFERTSKAVTLTDAGIELLPLATEILERVEQVQRTARTSARRVAGQIRIGFLGDEYAHPRADRLLTAVRRQHPRLVIEFSQVDFAEHHQALENGQVDVAFVLGPTPETIETVPLFDWPRFVAVPDGFAEQHADDIADRLRSEPIALPIQMASHAWRTAWTPTDQPTGPTFAVAEDSMERMLALVGAGRAYCVVPEYVTRFYPQPGVRFLASEDVGACQVSIGALRSRTGEPQIEAVMRTAATLDHPRAGAGHRRSAG